MAKRTELDPPRRVLLIKPSALGDVVTALPVLHGLRRSFPDAEIDWIVRDIYAPLIADQPGLRQVVTYDRGLLGRFWRPGAGMGHVRQLKRTLRGADYDWAIDLQGLLRSSAMAKWSRAAVRAGFADAREGAPLLYTHRFHLPVDEYHTVARNIALARELGVDARPEDLQLTVSDDARARARALLREVGLPPEEFLAIVPPTRWETKLYPVRRWRQVLSELPGELRVAVLGGRGDSELCRRIAEGFAAAVDLAGRTDLPALAAVLQAAGAVVCCDSASKFIAQAVGTQPVVLVGPTLAERTGHYPDAPCGGVSIVADVPCQGCLKKRCSHGTCMDLIPPGRVAAEAMNALELSPPRPSVLPDHPGE
jgi:lipopolysaccharide heptosyltransferase I